MAFFSMRIHKIYEKYIRHGAHEKVFITEEAYQDIRKKLTSMVNPDAHLFLEPSREIFEWLCLTVYEAFVKSDEYKKLQDLESKRKESRVLIGKIMEEKIKLPTLDEVTKKPLLPLFSSYLKEEHALQTLLFVREINDFRAIPYAQSDYLKGRAQKIFNKFLRRGAALEVIVGLEVKADIIAALQTPTLKIFDTAEEELKQELIDVEIPLFYHSDAYQKHLKEEARLEEESDTETTRPLTVKGKTIIGAGASDDEDEDNEVEGMTNFNMVLFTPHCA